LLTTLSTEDLIPPDHPIRKSRVVVDAVLAELDPIFDEMYATGALHAVAGHEALADSGPTTVSPTVAYRSTALRFGQ
jgi:hypothetical protein